MSTKRILTLVIVAGAVATMIGLGIWQLGRAEEKEALLAQYEAATDLDPVAYPVIVPAEPPLYRRSSLNCLEVVDWRHQAGANAAGQSGYAHVADCRTSAEGPGAAVEIGWSREPVAGTDWEGGEVAGVIGPDERYGFRLVAEAGQAGLETSAAPSPDAIRNNHMSYAFQWFAFAAIALIITFLAMRRKPKT
ncbi:SURF1 family protein [Sphingomicrobium sediminis]|uniref:SURF1-like protein n=1 Tax=Sphingomicrobium sediminis TaxID=2950949 RepID=A0A9X2J3P9_9SPHN|nr:SURF1 family protein [Sphingomicrobium sediminis]MCM8558280.1 SURF1 family protein [Sphingomicrobium sediminis]